MFLYLQQYAVMKNKYSGMLLFKKTYLFKNQECVGLCRVYTAISKKEP